MAFPAVEQAIENSTNTAGANHTINLPTATANQLLLIILDKGSTAATVNAHGSLTELLDENSANGLYIAYRWMDGSEPASYTLVTSANTRTASIAYRISGVINPTAVAPQIGTTGAGTSATPDPPASATPPSTKDYLFIAFYGAAGEEADDDTWSDTPPTNYTPSPPRQKACGTAGTNLGGMIAAAERQLNTGSAQDPGTFAKDASAAWRSQTITVHPPITTTVTPDVVSLTTVPFAPTITVTQNQRVTPTTASLSLSTFVPSAMAPRLVVPGVAALTLTSFDPTVTTSDHQTAVPGVASLTLTSFAPTVSVEAGGVTVTPASASLTTAAFAPTVSAPRLVTPSKTDLVLSTFTPTVAAPRLVTPTTASLSLTALTPTVSAPRTATPATASLISTAFAPTVALTDNQRVTPQAANLTLATFAASVLAPRTVIPATGSLTITGFAPGVYAGVTVTPSAASLSLTEFAPDVAITANQRVVPSTAALTVSGYAPSILTEGPQLIVPGTASLQLTTYAPTFGAETSITRSSKSTGDISADGDGMSGIIRRNKSSGSIQ